jgi:DNA invertase Pin-like site-specific DNA recombinase
MSPSVQRATITEYCTRNGLVIPDDHWYIDDRTSGKKPMSLRQAGSVLLHRLRKGDNLVVAKLDRLSRSFCEFGRLLEIFRNVGVTLHICDLPAGRLDPNDAIMGLLIHILVSFAEFERHMISIRTKEGLAEARARGRPMGRWMRYGFKREWRMDKLRGKRYSVAVRDESEQALIATAVAMRAQGFSIDQIRQHFSYDLKARTRMGKEFHDHHVRDMIRLGLRDMAQTVGPERKAR